MTDSAEEVRATVGVVDGRVAMSADVEADLQVHTPEVRPLSSIEPHATLRLALDSAELGALDDALQRSRSDQQ